MKIVSPVESQGSRRSRAQTAGSALASPERPDRPRAVPRDAGPSGSAPRDASPSPQPSRSSAPQFVAAAPSTLQVRELASKVAVIAAPVLIVGEAGAGKEALARFIHHRSGRPARSFFKVHCGSANQDLLESEIFGTGSSVGAGKLQLAGDGTLLLDQVVELGPALQAKLLRVLEEGVLVPGGRESGATTVRILSSCDLELERAVTRGDFRQDLYWRLRPIRLAIAPLRERRADIPKLCEHFLSRASRKDGPVPEIPGRLMDGFMRYQWPGNVRELEHVVEQFSIFPNVDFVLSELEQPPLASRVNGGARTLLRRGPGESHEPVQGAPGAPLGEAPGAGAVAADANALNGAELDGLDDLDDLHNLENGGRIRLKEIAARAAEEAEKRVVLKMLEKYHWNRKRAAARMDICYKTLLNKLERWDLDS